MLARRHVQPLTKVVRPSQSSLFYLFSPIMHQNILSFLGLLVGFSGFHFTGTEYEVLSKFRSIFNETQPSLN